MRAVLRMPVAPWKLAQSPVVGASDASEWGRGVCLAAVGADVAGSVGAFIERWRFRPEGFVNPRDQALAIDPDAVHASHSYDHDVFRLLLRRLLMWAWTPDHFGSKPSLVATQATVK